MKFEKAVGYIPVAPRFAQRPLGFLERLAEWVVPEI
jgi:hypothetical protein